MADSHVLSPMKVFLSEEQQGFRAATHVPPDLEEDLTYLARKWESGDLDNHLDRGLLLQRSVDGLHYRQVLDKTWAHRKTGDYYGAGHLVTGQRWPSRLHMRRDGAHDPPEAGISGTVKEGARSVVMGSHDLVNNRIYADRDLGITVRYVGTENKKGANERIDGAEENDEAQSRPSTHTRMLLASIRTGNPVRLFRSDKFSSLSRYTPTQGYRYDGLYIVYGKTLLDRDRQIYRFDMRRVPGQPPLREYDLRTFELTPEVIARRARQKEARRQARENAMHDS